jgi:hypothetical protein|tara:strand:+ start:13994 stop:14422 length:429 start_codon:yes stop_codon:yes gene_type:complete
MSLLDMFPRKLRKKTALLIFTIAFIMALPPAFPAGEIFSDMFLNLPTATFLNMKLGIEMLTALVLSFTVVPIILVYIGSVIYPANTERTFNGQFTRIRDFFMKYINLVKRNPIHLIWLVASFYIFFRLLGFYQTQVNIFIIG